MEPLTALDASPELVWVVGVLTLSVTLGLTMLCALHLAARQRAQRDNATRGNYPRENGKDKRF